MEKYDIFRDIAERTEGDIYLGVSGGVRTGKSTFIKILCGTYAPIEGEIYFEGNPVCIKDTGVAKALGISAIPQEFNLINDLNVYENIFLGKEYRIGYLLDHKIMIQKTKDLLKELQTEISPEEMIQNLSVAQKQMVEIAKAMADESKLLIITGDFYLSDSQIIKEDKEIHKTDDDDE